MRIKVSYACKKKKKETDKGASGKTKPPGLNIHIGSSRRERLWLDGDSKERNRAVNRDGHACNFCQDKLAD